MARFVIEGEAVSPTGVGYIGPKRFVVSEDPQPDQSDPTAGFTSTLQFGPLDTGIELPESVSVGLAGAGKRLSDIGTLGMRDIPASDEPLMRRPAAQVGAGIADISSLALPAVRTQQALMASRRLAAIPGAIRGPLSGGAVAGGIEGATRPGDFGERAGSAAAGMAFGSVGELGMRGLAGMAGGPLRATQITPEAQSLIDQGVPVPPWKATDSPRVRSFAERAKASFMGGPLINQGERRAFMEWNRNLVRNATPPQPVLDDAGNVLRWKENPITDVSDDSLNALRSRFNESYDALYKGRVIPIDQQYQDEVTLALDAAKRYYPSVAADVQGVAAKVDDILASVKSTTTAGPIVNAQGQPIQSTQLGHAGVTHGAIKQALDAVESAINSAWRQGNAEKAEALEGLSGALQSVRARSLPPEVQSMQRQINHNYQNFLQLQRASAMLGAQRAGMITPGQLLSAQKAMDTSKGKAAFARGNVPGQREALAAERVMGSTLPTVGPGTAEKLILAGMLSSPFALTGDFLTAGGAALLATDRGQRYLLGQLGGQARAANALARMSPYAVQGTRGFALDEQ